MSGEALAAVKRRRDERSPGIGIGQFRTSHLLHKYGSALLGCVPGYVPPNNSTRLSHPVTICLQVDVHSSI